MFQFMQRAALPVAQGHGPVCLRTQRWRGRASPIGTSHVHPSNCLGTMSLFQGQTLCSRKPSSGSRNLNCEVYGPLSQLGAVFKGWSRGTVSPRRKLRSVPASPRATDGKTSATTTAGVFPFCASQNRPHGTKSVLLDRFSAPKGKGNLPSPTPRGKTSVRGCGPLAPACGAVLAGPAFAFRSRCPIFQT